MKPGMTIVKGECAGCRDVYFGFQGLGVAEAVLVRGNNIGSREEVEPDRDWHCHLGRLGCKASMSTGCKTGPCGRWWMSKLSILGWGEGVGEEKSGNNIDDARSLGNRAFLDFFFFPL